MDDIVRIDLGESKVFVELPYFRRKWQHLGLSDDALRSLQARLMSRPREGDVVVGTGGLRKCRFAVPGSGRGKSGSYRVGYVYFEDLQVIGLIAIFAKNEQSNFTSAERAEVASLIDLLRQWLKKGGRR